MVNYKILIVNEKRCKMQPLKKETIKRLNKYSVKRNNK